MLMNWWGGGGVGCRFGNNVFAGGRGFAAVVGGGFGRPWVRILHSIVFCRLFHLKCSE